jgi:tripartite-type tricarboxylate transporter receptor subunit TctC
MDKAVLHMITRPNDFGRAIAAPEATPTARVAAWRRAFDKALTDPQFLADAKKRRLNVNYIPGKELQKIVDEIISTPKDVIRRAQAVIGIGKGKKK